MTTPPRCEFLAPLADRPSGTESPTAGLIIVPGAHLGGATYLPLLAAIQVQPPAYLRSMSTMQAAYPGSLWVGATSDWANEMPTPFEVTQQVRGRRNRKRWRGRRRKRSWQINRCLEAAEDRGIDTENVFMAGHSEDSVSLLL